MYLKLAVTEDMRQAWRTALDRAVYMRVDEPAGAAGISAGIRAVLDLIERDYNVPPTAWTEVDEYTSANGCVTLAMEPCVEPCQPIGCDNGQHLPGCELGILDGSIPEDHDDKPCTSCGACLVCGTCDHPVIVNGAGERLGWDV